MAVLFTNNAQAALSATITAAATSFSVTAGLGALFPSPGVGDYFYVTLADTAGNLEIVKVTARTTDTFTVVRGQDGTTARAFSAADKVELRLTKAMLDQIKLDTQQNVTGNLSFTGTGNRITGDFTNATYANRVLVQTSTANSNTYFGLIPSGTALNAQFQVFNSSDPANSSIGTLTAASATMRLVSGALGTGTILPWVVVFGSTEAVRFATSGNVLIGSATDNNTDKLQVTGSANITGAIKENGNQVLNAANYSSYSPSLTGSGASGTWGINVSGLAYYLRVADTRNAATTPQTTDMGVSFDFKANSTDGLSDGGGYFGEMTFRQYGSGTDWSGGASHQLGFTDNGNIWQRSGTGTSWGSWKKILDSSNYTDYAASASHTHSYLPLAGGTMTGTITGVSGTFLQVLAPGSGAYNKHALYANSTEFGLEAALATDVSNGTRLPILLTWRGGYASQGGFKLTGASSAELGGNTIFHHGNHHAQNAWTPNVSGGVTRVSQSMWAKTGGTTGWNAQLYSSEAYPTNVYCQASFGNASSDVMFGLNALDGSTDTDAGYSGIDYAWNAAANGNVYIYESGTNAGAFGAYTSSTILTITYDGTNVRYYKDGVLQRTVARSVGNGLYFDSSFYTTSSGAQLYNIEFGRLDPVVQSSGPVVWGAGSSIMNSGNPRSLAIGYSGGNYGSAGYGINYTTTSGLHTYAIADIVSRWDAQDGLIVYAAPSGSVGASVSWTTVLDARRSNSSLVFKGNTVLDSSNYSSYALPLSGGTLSGALNTRNVVVGSGAYIENYGGYYARSDYSVLDSAGTGWLTVIARNGGAPYINNVTYAGNTILHSGNYTSYVGGGITAGKAIAMAMIFGG